MPGNGFLDYPGLKVYNQNVKAMLRRIPSGPAGPDGNPIGTIISYMGLTAPKDYLNCDGSIYNF